MGETSAYTNQGITVSYVTPEEGPLEGFPQGDDGATIAPGELEQTIMDFDELKGGGKR